MSHNSYASQCVYSTQETIVPDVPAFARAVGAALQKSAANGASRPKAATPPIFILDGYHGFGAIPTDLAQADASSREEAVDMIYVSGLLKHVGSGANCAFMVLPTEDAKRVCRQDLSLQATWRYTCRRWSR